MSVSSKKAERLKKVREEGDEARNSSINRWNTVESSCITDREVQSRAISSRVSAKSARRPCRSDLLETVRANLRQTVSKVRLSDVSGIRLLLFKELYSAGFYICLYR